MGEMNEVKRFRTNPVEIVILMVIMLVFCNSVYNLFYDSHDFRPAALKPMAANPVSESRSPASTSQSFLNVEVKCGSSMDQDTSASKVRLSGPLCGLDSTTAAGQLTRTIVTNTTNRFSATVFTDVNASKFSTDYIPLGAGKNQIHLEFSYRNGKVANEDVTISKY